MCSDASSGRPVDYETQARSASHTIRDAQGPVSNGSDSIIAAHGQPKRAMIPPPVNGIGVAVPYAEHAGTSSEVGARLPKRDPECCCSGIVNDRCYHNGDRDENPTLCNDPVFARGVW